MPPVKLISKLIQWASTENPWSNPIVSLLLILPVFENKVEELVADTNITNQEPNDILKAIHNNYLIVTYALY